MCTTTVIFPISTRRSVYSAARLTVHIPRQQYTGAMAGIPTIRVFEALACGIPLLSAPWSDSEQAVPRGRFLRWFAAQPRCKKPSLPCSRIVKRQKPRRNGGWRRSLPATPAAIVPSN